MGEAIAVPGVAVPGLVWRFLPSGLGEIVGLVSSGLDGGVAISSSFTSSSATVSDVGGCGRSMDEMP